MTTTTVTTRSRFTRRIAAVAALVAAPALAFGLSPAAHAETGTQHFAECDLTHKDDKIWDGVKPPAHGVGEHSPKNPGHNLQVQWPGNDSTRGFAVHPGKHDIKAVQDLLVVPTVRETGIECPNLLRSDAPNYFKDAYDSIHFGSSPDWALGINSKDGRGYDQLHIHLTRLYGAAREDIDRAVKAGKVSKDEHKWVDQVIEVTDHDKTFVQTSKHAYRAWNANSIDTNFFAKLQDNVITPLVKQGNKQADMAHETMLVTLNHEGNGLIVLASDTNSGIHGVNQIEGIMDKR
ncbi:hypothetical protein A5642_25710 [Mycolicibacterium mucogenicum]|uniref:CDP-diacylglycerol diphosphatase n=1 Tax=Mycolicibacterium mucogenicum TaxID=56689 RepID=A0A1A0MH05_MYCMU|nr:CDP-diacylglycerol diphosphatase [Mycolicibacterium mucogenicum]OBA84734.1 hypothetical protein A5642_25710 [Mycolicibacterium mucogenicum]